MNSYNVTFTMHPSFRSRYQLTIEPLGHDVAPTEELVRKWWTRTRWQWDCGGIDELFVDGDRQWRIVVEDEADVDVCIEITDFTAAAKEVMTASETHTQSEIGAK